MKWMGIPFALWGLVLCSGLAIRAAEPVARQTDSVEADLISALIDRHQLELAARICESRLSESQIDDYKLARWLIQAARIDNAIAFHQEPAGDSATASSGKQRLASAEQIEQFLTRNPDFPQRSWLRYQQILNELSWVTRDALAVLVASEGQQKEVRDTVLARIVRVQGDLKTLTTEVEQQINEARSRTPATSDVQDLVSLVYVIAEKRLSTVLLQSDLFETGSQDFIAAATDAMSASKLMLDSLPAGSSTRAKFLKPYAESLRRLKRYPEAQSAIDEALALDARDGQTVATAIRIAIDSGKLDLARERMESFRSTGREDELEFNLAQLELVIAEAKQSSRPLDQQTLSLQVQRIRERFGPYAKRLAQRILFGAIPVESGEVRDPQLLMALAGQRMREGKADQAVDELMHAARKAVKSNDAVALAIAAAAIEKQRQNFAAASDCLREIALLHPDFDESPKLHYQASLIMREHWPANALAEQLQEFVTIWPKDPLAIDVAQWLDKLLVSLDDYEAAATSLVEVGVARADDALLRTAYSRWVTALARTETASLTVKAEEAIDQFRSSTNALASCLSLQLSLLCLPTAQIQPVASPGLVLLQSQPNFVWLTQVRGISLLGEGLVANAPVNAGPFSAGEHVLAIDRLIQDARQTPIAQSRIGKALLELDRVEALTLDKKILAHDWSADYATARSLVPKAFQANDPLVRRIAKVLSASKDSESRRMALVLWSQISARMPLGSSDWHEAKLATLELLVAGNQPDEASRLAEYVLLTQRPANVELIDRYRRFVKQQ